MSGDRKPWEREQSEFVDGWRAGVWAAVDKLEQLLAGSAHGYVSKLDAVDGLRAVAYDPPPPEKRERP